MKREMSHKKMWMGKHEMRDGTQENTQENEDG
jgi:hypothetical protein